MREKECGRARELLCKGLSRLLFVKEGMDSLEAIAQCLPKLSR